MKSYIFKFCLLFVAMSVLSPLCRASALDAMMPLSAGPHAADSVEGGGKENAPTRYDIRVERYRRMWNFLIPTQIIVQYAGNMGMMSLGVGWNYGNRRQYETNLLFGYLPRFNSERAKTTMTIKQNYIPWRIDLGGDFNAEPLKCRDTLDELALVAGHDSRHTLPHEDIHSHFRAEKLIVLIGIPGCRSDLRCRCFKRLSLRRWVVRR